MYRICNVSNFILIIEFILPYFIIIVVIYFMLHQGLHHEGINNGFPQGMKLYPIQFMRFPYYEEIKITHLFDTMHIENNVIETLWRIIDGRRDKEKLSKFVLTLKKTIMQCKV
jgi:hypothetical protein